MYQQAHEDQRTRPLRLVSIVAPVYNEAPTLREFTHRLIAVSRSVESLADFEFILIDDGRLARWAAVKPPYL